MSKQYLIINTGSTSKKYAYYDNKKKIYSAHFEISKNSIILTEKFNKITSNKNIKKDKYASAIKLVIDSLIKENIIKNKNNIDGVGIRIVAPGLYFLSNKKIDKKYLKFANEAVKKVPLHLGPALKEIENIKLFLGEKIPIFGISDSCFHSTIPEHSKLYAIPIKHTKKFGLYMCGYHGISIQSVIDRSKKILKGKLPKKIIVCHLGGGGSVTAVLNGKSIDTSMGFTPLEGLVMSTRVGDIDAGVVIQLSEKLKKTGKDLEDYLNNKCGLLGLSGKSGDMRDLLELEKNGHLDSSTAIKVYVNRIKQYIGKMSAMLGGVDLLILAGTIGERSPIIRERICEGLEFLGIKIDKKLNNNSSDTECSINKKDSKSKILIIKTDETEEMAKETLRLILNEN